MKTSFLKSLGLLTVAVLFAGTMNAQLSVGIRGGVNLANLTYDVEGLTIEPDNRLGFNVAALVNIPVAGDFSIQPELSFIQKGASLELDFGPETIESEIVYNYIEIPVMLKYGFGAEKIGGFVQAGPSVGYALNGKVTTDGEDEDIEFDTEGEEEKRIDFGLQFGAGARFMAGPGSIILDLRYLLGLTNLNDSDTSDDESFKTKGINITVGYVFPIGG